MFELIAVTNRHLCKTDFLSQIKEVASAGVSAIIVREKDLEEQEYGVLAKKVMAVCRAFGTTCILHTFADAARAAGAERIHLSLQAFAARPQIRNWFSRVGVSVHSVKQAREAAELGADYLVAGHIFETACKPGLAPRGLPFLKEVCGEASIPVFAIGGIGSGNIGLVREAGASGACLMSAFMEAGKAAHTLERLAKSLSFPAKSAPL